MGCNLPVYKVKQRDIEIKEEEKRMRGSIVEYQKVKNNEQNDILYDSSSEADSDEESKGQEPQKY